MSHIISANETCVTFSPEVEVQASSTFDNRNDSILYSLVVTTASNDNTPLTTENDN